MIRFTSSPAPLCIGKNIHIESPCRKRRDDYLEFLRRNENYHRPWVYHSYDPKYFNGYLERNNGGVTQGCFIIDNISDELIGVININNIMLKPICSASLGYFGDKDYSGKGYMTEAMKLVLAYGVNNLHLHRFEANIQPDNLASIKFIQKLGFRKEGFSPKYLRIGGKWCDHERWTILDEQIMAKD